VPGTGSLSSGKAAVQVDTGMTQPPVPSILMGTKRGCVRNIFDPSSTHPPMVVFGLKCGICFPASDLLGPGLYRRSFFPMSRGLHAAIVCSHGKLCSTLATTSQHAAFLAGFNGKFAHTDVVQNNSHSTPVGDPLDVLQSALEPGHIRTEYKAQNQRELLLHLLVDPRDAQCYDPRDKVFALLGVCCDGDKAAIRTSYARECTAAH